MTTIVSPMTSDVIQDNTYNPIWQIDDFEFGECLGNGKFGYVYRATEKRSKKELAIKVISKKIIQQFNFYQQLKNEVEIHSRLMYSYIHNLFRYKHIVRLYGYFYDNNFVYLVYELLTNGNLYAMVNNKLRLTEEEACKVDIS